MVATFLKTLWPETQVEAGKLFKSSKHFTAERAAGVISMKVCVCPQSFTQHMMEFSFFSSPSSFNFPL